MSSNKPVFKFRGLHREAVTEALRSCNPKTDATAALRRFELHIGRFDASKATPKELWALLDAGEISRKANALCELFEELRVGGGGNHVHRRIARCWFDDAGKETVQQQLQVMSDMADDLSDIDHAAEQVEALARLSVWKSKKWGRQGVLPAPRKLCTGLGRIHAQADDENPLWTETRRLGLEGA